MLANFADASIIVLNLAHKTFTSSRPAGSRIFVKSKLAKKHRPTIGMKASMLAKHHLKPFPMILPDNLTVLLMYVGVEG